jgi:hypothetical protein
MVALMLITVLSAASSADDISVSKEIVYTNTEPAESSAIAFLFGRIKNLYDDDYEIRFNAVNVRIISFIPEFGIYRWNFLLWY